MAKLPRKLVIVDERGRLSIPEYMRKELGWEPPFSVWIELYPSDNPKKLIISKG